MKLVAAEAERKYVYTNGKVKTYYNVTRIEVKFDVNYIGVRTNHTIHYIEHRDGRSAIDISDVKRVDIKADKFGKSRLIETTL